MSFLAWDAHAFAGVHRAAVPGIPPFARWIVVGLIVVLHGRCIGEERSAAGRELILTERRPMDFFGRIYIPPMEVNAKEQQIPFQITNPSGNSSIVLGAPKGTCGCARIEVSSATIAPGKSVDAVLTVAVRPQKRQPLWRQSVYFEGEKFGDGNVAIEIVSEIKEYLVFQEPEFLVQIAGESQRGEQSNERPISKILKFTATSPIRLEDLMLKVEPENSAVSGSINSIQDGVGELQLKILPTRVADAPIPLTLNLTDRRSEKSTFIRGVVARRPAISVIPSSIRLSRDDTGVLQGHAMIARHRSSGTVQEPSHEMPHVEASLFGEAVPLAQSLASANLVRIRLRIPEDMPRDFEETQGPKIRWYVLWGGNRAQLESRVIVTERELQPAKR